MNTIINSYYTTINYKTLKKYNVIPFFRFYLYKPKYQFTNQKLLQFKNDFTQKDTLSPCGEVTTHNSLEFRTNIYTEKIFILNCNLNNYHGLLIFTDEPINFYLITYINNDVIINEINNLEINNDEFINDGLLWYIVDKNNLYIKISIEEIKQKILNNKSIFDIFDNNDDYILL